jgi:hypothetical protein
MSFSRPPPRPSGKLWENRKTAATRLVDNVVIVVHTGSAPSNDEWKTYIDTVIDGGKRFGGDLRLCRQLVLSDGGGPNSAQRAMAQKAAEQMNGAQMPVAVVSASAFVRGIVTAFNWFNMNLKAFHPAEARHVIEFLGIDPLVAQEIWTELEEIQEELGPVKTVEAFREAFEQPHE